MYLTLAVFHASLAAAFYTASSSVVLAGADELAPAGPLLQPAKSCVAESINPDEASPGIPPFLANMTKRRRKGKKANFGSFCHKGTQCPIVNGEPLGLCGRACYSSYLYSCRDGELELLPSLRRGRISLRAENMLDPGYASSPYDPPAPGYGEDSGRPPAVVDGKPMTACRLAWNVGGITCSYCPVPPVDPSRCPAGNVTRLSASSNAMDVVVPGGQRFFLTEGWTVGYTQAHSSLQPNGSTTAGFRAFEGGGFFNLLDGAWGWAACGEGEQKVLHVRNSTNGDELRNCVGLNLKVEQTEGDEEGAWQYS